MPASEAIDPRVNLVALLAYELRRQREARSLSQDQLAKELYSTRASIQAYEAQRNRPSEEFCADLDRYFETGELFRAMWHHAQREHLRQWLEAYLAHENEATQIRTFQPMSIPGLLQTEGYIRAGLGTLEDLDERVRQRLARRDILTEENPPLLWVVLDEAAIRRPVGGAAVMREQLKHLLEMSELPNITTQVVRERMGSYLGMTGAFLLLTLPDHRTVGYVEAQFGGRLIEDPSEVTRLGVRYDHIRAKALSDEASRALIQKTMEKLRDDPMAEE